MPIGLGVVGSDGSVSYFMNMYTFAVRIVYAADGSVFIESTAGNSGLTVQAAIDIFSVMARNKRH